MSDRVKARAMPRRAWVPTDWPQAHRCLACGGTLLAISPGTSRRFCNACCARLNGEPPPGPGTWPDVQHANGGTPHDDPRR